MMYQTMVVEERDGPPTDLRNKGPKVIRLTFNRDHDKHLSRILQDTSAPKMKILAQRKAYFADF